MRPKDDWAQDRYGFGRRVEDQMGTWVGKAKVIAGLVRDVGAPILLIFVGLGFYAGYIPSPLTEVVMQHNHLGQALEEHRKHNEDTTNRLVTLEREQIRVMRIICRKLSKPDGFECDEWWRDRESVPPTPGGSSGGPR